MLDKLCDQYAEKGQANLAAMLSLLLHDPLRAVEFYRCAHSRPPALLCLQTRVVHTIDRINWILRLVCCAWAPPHLLRQLLLPTCTLLGG